MSTNKLQSILNDILTDKNTNLLPTNLREGVTCLCIDGTYEGSGGETTEGIKQFSTIEEMNNSTGNKEGDLAIVYGGNYTDVNQFTLPLTYIVFPDKIVTTSTISSTYNLYAGDGSSCNLEIDLTALECKIFNQDTTALYAKYTSTDGKNYILSEGSNNITFTPTITTYYNSSPYCYEFLKQGGIMFEGLFEYTSSTWKTASTGLSASNNDVFADSRYLGVNGVGTGTLGNNISNLFNDNSAIIYVNARKAYDNMEPITLTNDNKDMYIQKDIRTIPTNKNGETLLDFSQLTSVYRIFYRCYNLEYVGAIDLSNCTNMSYMFYETNISKPIILNNIDNITNMNYMFSYSPNITSVTFNGTPQLTSSASLEGLFQGKSKLEEINGLDLSTYNGAMDYFCSGCSKLKSFNLEGLGSITTFQYCFSGCSSLEDICYLDTSNISGTAVKRLRGMFNGCKKLTNTSLNTILLMCINANQVDTYKTLAHIGLTEEQATVCTTLSNYEAFTAAGWTTGY